MSTWNLFLGGLVVFGTIVGCGDGRLPPADTNAVEAETNAVEVETEEMPPETPAVVAKIEAEKPLNAYWVLERLKESCASLPPDSSTEWAIAHSCVTWSTCTVAFEVPFPEDAAERVWAAWTQPVSALTIKANRQIKAEIDAAVSDAVREKSRAEREFDFRGFKIFINASAVPNEDMSFVRISFTKAD